MAGICSRKIYYRKAWADLKFVKKKLHYPIFGQKNFTHWKWWLFLPAIKQCKCIIIINLVLEKFTQLTKFLHDCRLPVAAVAINFNSEHGVGTNFIVISFCCKYHICFVFNLVLRTGLALQTQLFSADNTLLLKLKYLKIIFLNKIYSQNWTFQA